MLNDDTGPFSLEVLKNTEVPSLFTTDASVWRQRLVDWFESASGRTLFPAQVEMLLIETFAYTLSIAGSEAQMVAEQNFVAFAKGLNLDALGANRSTLRLPAAFAKTTLRFSIGVAQPSNLVVAANSIVRAGAIGFKTDAPMIIRSGTLEGTVTATALEAGVAANGLTLGQISLLENPIIGVSVANITPSSDGADVESDALFRLRVANAFDRIPSSGGFGWYRETAMSVSASLIDCGVVRPQPCVIVLYPLTATGAAGLETRNAILAAFNTARSLENRFGDDLSVLPPIAVIVTPVLTVRVRGIAAYMQDDIRTAANKILDKSKQQLGATIAPSEVEASVRTLSFVVDVEVTGLNFRILANNEFLLPSSLTINIVVLS